MPDEDQKQEQAGASAAQSEQKPTAPAEANVEAGKDAEMTNGESTKGEKAAESENVNSESKSDAPAEANGESKDEAAATDGKKEEGNREESSSPYQKRKERGDRHDRNDRDNNRGDRKPKYQKNFQHRKPNNNNRARFENQPESDDAGEIRHQVEFYFSDSNLPIDAYLLGLTGGHENKPVDLKTIHNFKRMRHFQPYSAVRDAVKASKILQLDDEDRITRAKPLDDKFTDDAQKNRSLVHTASMSRSIYAKGFGDENDTTHLDIENFFQPYGPIKAVRLRRHDDGEFKGSVFVEFEDEDTQKRFLELDPKPAFVDDKPLQVSSKQEYVDTKHQGIMDGTVRPKSPTRPYRGGRGRGGGGVRGRDKDGDGKFDRDDWKSRRDNDQRGGRGGRGRGRGRGGDRGGRGRGGGRRDDRDGRKRSRSPAGDEDEIDRISKRNKEKKDAGQAGDDAAANAEKKAEAEKPAAAQAEGESKKRGREEEGGESQGGEAKKAKPEQQGEAVA